MERQLTAQRFFCSALALLFACVPLAARAGDAGPRRDVADVRYAATRLLARRLRVTDIEPKLAVVSGVVVLKNEALLAWSAGHAGGIMGMTRYLDRWWDDFDQFTLRGSGCVQTLASFPLGVRKSEYGTPDSTLVTEDFSKETVALARAHLPSLSLAFAGCAVGMYSVNPDAAMFVGPSGGSMNNNREKSGYDFTLKYSANNAPYGAQFTSLRVRAPSAGEIISYPSPPQGSSGSTGVLYYYLDLASNAPVTFAAGSKIGVWVPFVLDDSLRYEVNLFEPPLTVGPVRGTIFDNVLQFELPAFTAVPGELGGEVDAFW